MLFIAGYSGCRLIRDLLIFLISGMILFGIVHGLTAGSMMLLSVAARNLVFFLPQ